MPDVTIELDLVAHPMLEHCRFDAACADELLNACVLDYGLLIMSTV
jgi:hypothetical protein